MAVAAVEMVVTAAVAVAVAVRLPIQEYIVHVLCRSVRLTHMQYGDKFNFDAFVCILARFLEGTKVTFG